jgi:DNA-binding transcriptional MerR regulator
VSQERRKTQFTISVAAQHTGLSHHIVRRCVRLGLVSEELTETELAELRRIRRLVDLGVNLAGIQVVMGMRRQIEELRAERARLAALVASSRRAER